MTKAVPDKSKTGFARRVASRGLDVLLPYRSEARKLKQATDALKRKVGGLTQDSARLKQERHGHIETIKALRQQCGELERIAPFHARGRAVIAHLGNGASMCAIRDGKSVASTMGFSALDGLPMGTRCGQLDPGVLLYLMAERRMSAAEIEDLLYRRSGLLGLSGVSHDMRLIEASGSPEALQAIDYFVFRVKRELGGMAAVLSGLDAVVFCGGIGENAAHIRERICQGSEWLGLELDEARNRAGETVISTDRSRVRVLVIRTNEEAMIARHTARLLTAS